jgi:hypothetical protein
LPRIQSTSRSPSVSVASSPPRSDRITPIQRPRAEIGVQTTCAPEPVDVLGRKLLGQIARDLEHAVLGQRAHRQRRGLGGEEVVGEEIEVDAVAAGGVNAPARRVVAEDHDPAHRRAARDALAEAAVEVVAEPSSSLWASTSAKISSASALASAVAPSGWRPGLDFCGGLSSRVAAGRPARYIVHPAAHA